MYVAFAMFVRQVSLKLRLDTFINNVCSSVRVHVANNCSKEHSKPGSCCEIYTVFAGERYGGTTRFKPNRLHECGKIVRQELGSLKTEDKRTRFFHDLKMRE